MSTLRSFRRTYLASLAATLGLLVGAHSAAAADDWGGDTYEDEVVVHYYDEDGYDGDTDGLCGRFAPDRCCEASRASLVPVLAEVDSLPRSQQQLAIADVTTDLGVTFSGSLGESADKIRPPIPLLLNSWSTASCIRPPDGRKTTP